MGYGEVGLYVKPGGVGEVGLYVKPGGVGESERAAFA